jgi:4-methyl-5(b-hydroxyethyl)-thiazole monophosphate biosynthesis
MSVHALVPLAEGFEELEAVAIIDILRRAGVVVVTAALEHLKVTGSHGITVLAERLLADVLPAELEEFQAIVLPGGPGTALLKGSEELRRALVWAAEREVLVAAICAAPSVLAAAGLLRGRRATCFPAVEEQLSGATILHEAVVRDGNIITSRGAGTAVAFALAVAARLAGEDKARAISQAILHQTSSDPEGV